MSKIRGVGGYRFEHDGGEYLVSVLATAEGTTLIANRREGSGAFEETGHGACLPTTATSDDARDSIRRLQERIEAGDAPDEERAHHGN